MKFRITFENTFIIVADVVIVSVCVCVCDDSEVNVHGVHVQVKEQLC